MSGEKPDGKRLVVKLTLITTMPFTRPERTSRRTLALQQKEREKKLQCSDNSIQPLNVGACEINAELGPKDFFYQHFLKLTKGDTFPVNMLNPTQKRFGHSQLRLIRPVCSQNQARLYVPDPTSYIQFSSVSPKKAWTILCKTNLNLIWMTWSGFGQMHLV